MLGVKIERDCSKKLLCLSQQIYIAKVLERFRMNNAKPTDTLVEKGFLLTLNHRPKNEEEQNQKSKVPFWKSDVCYVVYTTGYMVCSRSR